MRALWEQVRRWWLSIAATLAAVTVPFAAVLTGSRTAMYGDVNAQTVPFFASVWREIRGAGSAFWNPNIFAGHSTVGTGQFAVFYPFNFVFGWLEPVHAYRWWFLFHLWAAGLSAFAWAWHRWRSRPGAVIAGAGYALSGYIVFHLMHPAFLAAAAWLPLAFLGVD
ncbi:MAG TPA: YfhO family protein, partial [Acidimicrobiia bacterium]|nr:YfhO family protein [Acidimicrobiia bacterium]